MDEQLPAEEYVGPAVVSAGSTTPDAGSTTRDAGSTTPDAGSTTRDAGSTTQDESPDADVVSRLADARTSTTQEDAPTPAASHETARDSVTVDVTLRGHFEPIDGRYHWYGRLAADEALSRWQPGTTVVLTTPAGSAAGRLSDLDPWGRYRISGTGRPPF